MLERQGVAKSRRSQIRLRREGWKVGDGEETRRSQDGDPRINPRCAGRTEGLLSHRRLHSRKATVGKMNEHRKVRCSLSAMNSVTQAKAKTRPNRHGA